VYGVNSESAAVHLERPLFVGPAVLEGKKKSNAQLSFYSGSNFFLSVSLFFVSPGLPGQQTLNYASI
jgi:hypothetical protein